MKKQLSTLLKSWSALFICASVLTMMGCAPLTKQSQVDRSLQASLLQPCQRGTPLEEKTGKALLQKTTELAYLLNKCADEKDALNEALR